MSWTRMAGTLALLYTVLALLLQQTAALRTTREKQIKLEDIERDNLQTELVKQQQQHRPDGHPAYHQQQQQQQQQEEGEQAHHGHYHHYQPQPQHAHLHHHQQHPQPHFRYEQPAQHQQQHLLYQAAASAAPASPAASTPAPGLLPTHIMYLLMPNGNVAAFQLAPAAHPNAIPAYYSKPHLQHGFQHGLGALYHQGAQGYHGLQGLHSLQNQAVVPMVQYVPSHAPSQVQYVHQPAGQPVQHGASQRYQLQLQQQLQHQLQHQQHQQHQPTVHHQPTLSFNSPQAHQLHAQHFRELAAESPSSSSSSSLAALAAAAAGPEYGQQSEQPQPQAAVQQSHKSLFGSGVKTTRSEPQLKGSFSTQTGQSYANFRTYG